MFRAHDPVEGRLVAIKAFRLEIPPEQAAEFAVELEDLAANQPRHPGLAAALAAGVQGTTPYLAQEYVAGEALDAALRQFGPPPASETLTTLRRVAEALDRAAGDDIHHGTLHPRDILIADGGDARVIDVGVAQALARSGLRVPVRRPYSAPERVAEGEWHGAADIYALGAIAFELISGRRLAGPGRPDLTGPPLTAATADALADVLARALDPDPAERYPSATDLVDALVPHLPSGRRSTRRRSSAEVPLPLDAAADERAPAASAPTPTEDERAQAEGETKQPEAMPPVVAFGVEPTITVTPTEFESEVELVPLDAPPFEGAQSRFSSLDEEPQTGRDAADLAALARPGPHEPQEETPVVGWSPTVALERAPDRRPLLPLLMALIVGVAAGFGWGYWTAFRTLNRPSPTAIANATGETPAPEAAPTRVEDPEVIGERNLPPPTSAPAAAARAPQPSASSPAERPARGAAAPPPPKPAPPSGRLLVRSTPSGAQVRVDGRVRGRTPLDLRDLPLRVLRVSVERSGYQADERRVVLTSAAPSATVEARLTAAAPATPAATTGSLLVESRPSGAAVFVDGRQVGSTPLSLPDLSPGTRRIRLQLAGFNPWVTTADVQAGTRTRVAASLERGIQE